MAAGLIESKLQQLGLDQDPEAFVAGLPPHIKRRVEALQDLQKSKDELESKFRKEKAELEAKYEKLYAPLYSERSQIVAGDKAVPPKEGEPADPADVKGIPEFWATVLLKCDITAELIKDKDFEVLKFLTNITSEQDFEDGAPRGFTLKFHFAENPYFTNTVLEKKYVMLPEDEGVLEKAVGTKIEWKEGKDVTVKLMKKKPKKGAKADAKPQMKTEKVESFFNFFSPPEVPGEDASIDEEEMEELQALIEADYEVGATIREKLVAKAVSWYTGEAIEDEPYYFGGDDEDEEGFEDEEDEDEEDDDA
mmetsp:Transcript_22657/g.49637  ORF Transcript_22657/g.49637 Transcript_22657/m.49637 type:complete len:307 (-) Transcript_22657:643-1563(-)